MQLTENEERKITPEIASWLTLAGVSGAMSELARIDPKLLMGSLSNLLQWRQLLDSIIKDVENNRG